MRNFSILIVLLLCVVASSNAETQSPDSLDYSESMYLAEEYIEASNYGKAIEMYLPLLDENPEDPLLNFYIGYCYLNTVNQKDEATKYLAKSVESSPAEGEPQKSFMDILRRTTILNEVPREARFFLGKAYHVNYKFQEALNVYNVLLPMLDPEEDDLFYAEIEREMRECQNGIVITKMPVEMKIESLGKTINSEYSDHSPVLSADESQLIFTSKREFEGSTLGASGEYDENLYVAYKNEDGTWSMPQSMGSDINRSGIHDASVSVTTDGKQLYIYRDDEGDGNLYFCKQEGSEWSAPEKLPEPINTEYFESHASISADGTELYFVSDRPVGEKKFLFFRWGGEDKGKDIWVIKRTPDGEWGEPLNLGEKLNTELNESSPFIHPDGTLYYSSQGHKTIGGYDIFKTAIDDNGEWSEPENIGYPINTTGNDVFYVVSANGERAYYASEQKSSESLGGADIYQIGFSDDNVNNLAIFGGVVKLSDGKSPKDVKITVTEIETEEVDGIYMCDVTTGRYITIFGPTKEYIIDYECAGYLPYRDTLGVDYSQSYARTLKENAIDTVTLISEADALALLIKERGYTVSNFQFKVNEYENKNVLSDLKSFADYMITYTKVEGGNPDLLIEVGGYASLEGTAGWNNVLARKRAEFVKDYLERNGVRSDLVSAKGYGTSNPITYNKDLDGAFIWGSLRYNRRIEFKVIKPAKNLFIKVDNFDVPKIYLIKK